MGYTAILGNHPLSGSNNWSITVAGFSISNGSRYETLTRRKRDSKGNKLDELETVTLTDDVCKELMTEAKKNGFSLFFKGTVEVKVETDDDEEDLVREAPTFEEGEAYMKEHGIKKDDDTSGKKKRRNK